MKHFIVLTLFLVALTFTSKIPIINSAYADFSPLEFSPSRWDSKNGMCRSGESECGDRQECTKVGDKCHSCPDKYQYEDSLDRCLRCPEGYNLRIENGNKRCVKP